MTSYQNLDAEVIQLLLPNLTKKTNRTILPGQDYIPVTGKVIDEQDLLAGIDAVMDGWLTTGRFGKKFEFQFAKYFGAKFSILVNSGSSANLCAFYALTSPKLGERQIKPGDEVITVAAGFPTTVNPMIQYGAVPVFLDVDIPTYNIKAELIESAITPKTKAIMIAHSLGNPFNLDVVMEVAKRHNLWVVEDDCDSLGATYRGQKTGTFGVWQRFHFIQPITLRWAKAEQC
jgi:CDP-4-dehydro-6-deoxyglucose reductase, E1